MKNLTLTLEEEISILDKYRITPNELMFIRTLLLLQDEENEDIFKLYIEALYKCEVKTREVILSLQSKGIILKSFHCPNEGEGTLRLSRKKDRICLPGIQSAQRNDRRRESSPCH